MKIIGILNQQRNKAIHKLAESKGWSEGSTEKVLTHGALGAILGDLSGGSAFTGSMTGGISEYVTGYLEKTKGKAWMEEHPDAVQNIAAVVGGALGSLAGEAESGAYHGQSGVKWNFLGFQMGMKDLLQNNLKKADGTALTDDEARELSLVIGDVAAAADPYGANTDQLESGDGGVQQAVKQYLEGQGFGEEGIDQYLKEYHNLIGSYQEEIKQKKNWMLPLIKRAGDALESGSDLPAIKYGIGVANHISDAADIATSEHPADRAFSIAVGSEIGVATAGIVYGLSNIIMKNSPWSLAASGAIGGYVGDQVTDNINNKLEDQKSEQEKEEDKNQEER